MWKKYITICIAALLCGLLCGCAGKADEDVMSLAKLGAQEADAGGVAGEPLADGEGAGNDGAGAGNSGTGARNVTGVPEEGAAASGGTSESGPGTGGSAGVIYVHVCGAVNEPGVVELPEGSRAEAGVSAAGGMRADADTDYVNLAAPLADGEKLYIPTLEEGRALKEQEAEKESGLVNINTADSAALCTLPGIGESRAASIIAYREEHGAFQSVEDIMKVSGIGESAFGKLKDLITV